MKAEKQVINQPGSGHWSEARMLDHLYGLDTPADLNERHLAECPDCAPRWTALTARRAKIVAGAYAAREDRLRAQRAAIFDRIERPSRRGLWSLVPAAATALLLVTGVALQTPAPAPQPQTVAVVSQSDRELFREVAALMEEDVPRATDPFNSLFETSNSLEVQ
ncbi:MAG TPA: hypothetical protein PLF84_00620 [Bryobacteraceae bacterium]|nr:hypothetical protein [Bryobacterales bacterium]HRJ17505.1 hypothetical protein [Bryobacteraceae bacterium]